MSRDFTSGYGPVEYLLKGAKVGKYTIMLKLFASNRVGGTTVSLKIWTDFGRPQKEQEFTYTVRLEKIKQTVTVANVTFYW